MNNYLAIGNLVLDIYLDENHIPLGYYSGGSIWNNLINIKNLKHTAHCFGIGTCGQDWAGDFLLDIFSQHDIDMSSIKRTKHQTNRFNIIVNGEKTKSQKTCSKCGQTLWYSGTTSLKCVPQKFSEIDPGVVIVDCLKQDVLAIAKEFKQNGWLISADIGYISHLRYLSMEKIRTLLIDRFDILQINDSVYRFLASKLSLTDETELYKLLGCHYLSITNGANGSAFLYKDEENQIITHSVSAKIVNAIDPTGAGDMYFSTLLASLDKYGKLIGKIEEILDLAANNAANRTLTVGGVGLLRQLEITEGDCLVCGYKKTATTASRCRRKQIETNTTHLFDRILRSLESQASNFVKSVLDGIDGTICMVGTGGSFASACYAAEVINEHHKTAKAFACHPRNALIDGLKKVNAVFLFSYSGNTKDILAVYSMCIANSVPVYLVTKKRCSSLTDLNPTSIISYSNSNSDAKERGFLSMAGTLIPMCTFVQAFWNESAFTFNEFLKNCFINRNREFCRGLDNKIPTTSRCTVDVFYEKSSICAAIDFESKLVESGVGRVVLHEKKDFSHGRFNILERMPPDYIVFFEGTDGRYSEKLKRYLERRNIPTVFIKTQYSGVLGQLDLTIATQHFLNALSKHLDYDMSKPDYPKDAMALYRYSGQDLF